MHSLQLVAHLVLCGSNHFKSLVLYSALLPLTVQITHLFLAGAQV